MLLVVRLIRLLLLVALALWASVASAQTHPCDEPPVSSGVHVEGPITLGWCHGLLDVNNEPTVITGWNLYINNVPQAVPVTTDGVRSPATGEMLFTTTVLFQRGIFTLAVSSENAAGESAQTSPFDLGVVGSEPVLAVPKAPRSTRVL